MDRREITYGIKAEAISDLIEKKRMNEKVLIAEGIPAKKGKDGWFEFFVRLDLPRIPAPLADGGVDYVNIEAFEMVEKGEKIAVYHHAEKGRDGKNIYGEVLHGDSGTEKKPLRGVGFEIAPDGVTYRSKMNGKFEYINGRINITNMLVVREDVTAVTGKLEVDGSVYVIGSIYSGGYIKASGDIIIEYNVETARLIAGGNVMIKKGSCSKHDCFIDAGGEVSGSFFEAANINARGNVKANYIMNSNINTLGRVIVSGSKGVLLGGRICAVKGVDTHNLGNSAHLKTILDVGRNALYEKEQALFAEKREQLLNEIAMLEKGWNMLLQMITAKKEVSKEMVSKVHATLTVKGQELADLDAEATKLANETDQTVKAFVCVRGNAYGGSIFEDNEIERAILAELFQPEYKILEAENGKEGIALLTSHFSSIAVVLLDYMLPVMDGFEVLQYLKEKKTLTKIPFIMITGHDSHETEIRGYEYGIVSYIRKPYQPAVIKQVVSNAVGWFHYKLKLEVVVKKQNESLKKQNELLKQHTQKLNQLNEALIDSLSNIVEFRNLGTRQHIKRVREFVLCLGNSVMKHYPEYNLTQKQLEKIGWASSLHDIGKIAIPDNIILKAGKLTKDEFEIVKSHTTKGEEMIAQSLKLNDEELFDYACDIARHHHEKYDGKGYPDGLKGDEISIAAQIVSLVDIYDALVTKRVYKMAYEPEKAYQMIINGSSGAFSPKLLKAFTEVKAEFEKLLVMYRDEE